MKDFPREWGKGYLHVHAKEFDDGNCVDLFSEVFEKEGDDEEQHLHDGRIVFYFKKRMIKQPSLHSMSSNADVFRMPSMMSFNSFGSFEKSSKMCLETSTA